MERSYTNLKFVPPCSLSKYSQVRTHISGHNNNKKKLLVLKFRQLNWFLNSALLLHLSTQSTLYNMSHSPVHTHIHKNTVFLQELSNLNTHSHSDERIREQLRV